MSRARKQPPARAQVFVTSVQGQTLTINCQHRDKHRLDIKCDCGLSMIGAIAHGDECGWITSKSNRWNSLMSPRGNFSAELHEVFQAFHADTFEAIVLAEEVMRDLDSACVSWEAYEHSNDPLYKQRLQKMEALEARRKQQARKIAQLRRLENIFSGKKIRKIVIREEQKTASLEKIIAQENDSLSRLVKTPALYR